jgi:hypothetical protein
MCHNGRIISDTGNGTAITEHATVVVRLCILFEEIFGSNIDIYSVYTTLGLPQPT